MNDSAFGCAMGLSSEDLARASMQVSMEMNDDERNTPEMTICAVARRVMALEQTTSSFADALAANTKTTIEIKEGTTELLDLLRSFKGAMKVLEMIGKLARPLGYIAALVAGVIALWPKK